MAMSTVDFILFGSCLYTTLKDDMLYKYINKIRAALSAVLILLLLILSNM